MAIFKKIINIIWTFFSIILIALLKLIALILCIPIIIVKTLIYIIGSWISFLGFLCAGILLLLLILNWNDCGVGYYAIANRCLMLLVIFITGGLPFLVTIYGAVFLEFLKELLKIFIFKVPFNILSFNRKNVYEEYFENAYQSYNDTKSEFHDNSENTYTENTSFSSSNFFAGVSSGEQLKKRYKDLLKIYHPDNQSGDTSVSQQIQEEYEQLIKQYE